MPTKTDPLTWPTILLRIALFGTAIAMLVVFVILTLEVLAAVGS